MQLGQSKADKGRRYCKYTGHCSPEDLQGSRRVCSVEEEGGRRALQRRVWLHELRGHKVVLQQYKEGAAHNRNGQLAEAHNTLQCLLALGRQDVEYILCERNRTS